MLSKDRCKTTAGFFVIPLLSQLWEEKNYCERRNELSSWRPVALPNHHIHLYLFMLGYDVLALLSSVMYILSGENSTAVFTISRRRWDQNTTQVPYRLNRARATYVRLLHLPPWSHVRLYGSMYTNSLGTDDRKQNMYIGPIFGVLTFVAVITVLLKEGSIFTSRGRILGRYWVLRVFLLAIHSHLY